MLFLSLYERLPWCLKCCAFINLGKINTFTGYNSFNMAEESATLNFDQRDSGILAWFQDS